MTQMVPQVGSRFESRPHRGARRVYELVESLPEGAPVPQDRYPGDRHTIRVIAEEGFMPSSAYGVGWEFHVEDQWFAERRLLLKAVA